MNLVDKFGEDDCSENEARTSVLTNGPTRADYLSSNHVSHAISNFFSNSAKNVSNYLSPDIKKAFDQLRQAFPKAPIFQHFNPDQYIRVKIDASGHAIGRVLS